ncbi:MAG TPA: DMT family transporter [Candidatus Saccharimonadales bacterium]|nr:DMT family transporter [Candidatus Saccharimonadales bacterium]
MDHHEHHARRLQLKTLPLILISILLGPLGNVLLGKGMKSVGHIELHGAGDLPAVALRVFSTPVLWLGIACLLGFFLVHMLLLTWADYSYVQPATALSYATVALLSYFLLGEYVSPLRWAGIGLICFGVLVVGRTSPNTTAVP